MSQQTSPQPRGRPEFVTLIAVYQFVTAGILLLLSCLIPAVIFPSMFLFVGATEGVFSGLFMATVVLTLLLGFAFASIAVGWGLLRMREWARLGTIVLAAFALVGFPIWTIVAILILIYLTSEDGRAAFGSREASRAARTETPEQAVYKAEPPTSPAEETRRIASAGPATTTPGKTNGSPEPDEVVSGDETGSVPMPPEDPAWATESFYDEEADVTDHFRRWKATLPQESEVEPTEAETVEMPPEPAEEPATPEERDAGDEPLSSDEGDMEKRVWGPEEGQDTSQSDNQTSSEDDDERPERPRDG